MIDLYDVKCDECKGLIRRSAILADSVAGGTCGTCRLGFLARRGPNGRKLAAAMLTMSKPGWKLDDVRAAVRR